MAAANFQIPKDFYEIWIGSEIKDEYKRNIESWIAQNPDYTFHLIIDSSDIGETDIEARAALENTIKFCNKNNIKLHDLNSEYLLNDELDPNNKVNKISYANLAKIYGEDSVNLIRAMIHPEILGKTPEEKDRLKKHPFFKNYGAASDILRYMILDQFGGVYCDTDDPSIEGSTINDLTLTHGIRVAGNFTSSTTIGNSKGKTINLDPNNIGEFSIPNNDFIASISGHELIKKMLQSSIDQYKKHYFSENLPSYLADENNLIKALFDLSPDEILTMREAKRDFTIYSSGPDCMRRMFSTLLKDPAFRRKYNITEENFEKYQDFLNATKALDERANDDEVPIHVPCYLNLCVKENSLVKTNSDQSWLKTPEVQNEAPKLSEKPSPAELVSRERARTLLKIAPKDEPREHIPHVRC